MTRPYDDPDARPDELARLREDLAVPPALEGRVVASLRAGGILRGRNPGRRRWLYTTGLIAASVAGFFLGRTSLAPDLTNSVAAPASRWMLLLYEDDTFEAPAPGKEQTYVEEYARWAAELTRTGELVSGAELLPGGALLGPGTADTSSVEVEGQGAGRLTGYFMVRAPTLARAAEIASTCPHLTHRGRIAIRPVGPG